MKLLDWLDERVGYRTWWQKLADHPIAGPPSWLASIGFAFAACVLLEVTTGIALMTIYAPSTTTAWASVHYVQNIVPFGWLVRGLHRTASDALVVLAGLHVFALVVGAAYRRPREVGFWISLVFVLLVMIANITGGLLPWDQLGWWARSVESNIAAMGPGGSGLVRFLQGGPEIGNITLTRAYTMHVFVLPIAFTLAFLLRRSIERKHALASPLRRRYFPGQLARDLAVAAIAFAVIAILVKRTHGATLGAPADPSSDYPARPEWFLLWMYELRHRMPKALEFWGTALIPPLFGVIVALLPWIDRRNAFEEKGPRFRLRAVVPVIVIGGIIGAFGYVAMQKDKKDAEYQKAIAKWNDVAKKANALAMDGVPPDGPLAMLDRDPDLRGEKLFTQHCASCHTLGALGDPKKASAPSLDGWSTQPWILSMLHDPDGDNRFGRTPYKGGMPSMDVAPPDKPDFAPMTKEDMLVVASFLASMGDPKPEESMPKEARDAAEKIVSERCTACHLYKGEGDDGGQNLAPELSGYGSHAWIRAQIANPATKATYREGALDPQLKGHMPRFDVDLSPADIDLLAHWVQQRARASQPKP